MKKRQTAKRTQNRDFRFSDVITATVFSLLLLAFCVAHFILPDVDFSPAENRMLAQMPRPFAHSIVDGAFGRDCESYVSDQFPLRGDWISLKTMAERRLFFREESKGVYFADNGYLIESHDGAFSTPQAERNRDALVQFAKEYAPRFGDGHFSVLVAPNAVDVLAELLPPFAPPSDGHAYCAELASLLPGGVFCDVSQTLRAHRDEYVYFRTDHHWTMRAAFYAYQEFAKKIGVAVPKIEECDVFPVTNSFEGTVQSKLGVHGISDSIEVFFPKKSVNTRMQTNTMEWRNLFYDAPLLTKDKYAYFLGGNAPFARIRLDEAAGNGRRILVIKDSYANCFIPFLACSFSEIDVLDLRYARRSVRELISHGEYTDVLVLYNAAGFAADESVTRLLM